jgi:hypothetical protein
MRTIKTYSKGAPFYNAFIRQCPAKSVEINRVSSSSFYPNAMFQLPVKSASLRRHNQALSITSGTNRFFSAKVNLLEISNMSNYLLFKENCAAEQAAGFIESPSHSNNQSR